MIYNYTLEKLNESIINPMEWSLLENYEEFKSYLILSQNYWENYYGHLFTQRTVYLWINPTATIITLPIKFIKTITQCKTLYYDNDITNYIKIINLNTIEIPFNYINTSLSMEYVAYGFINAKIEEDIIKKALSYYEYVV